MRQYMGSRAIVLLVIALYGFASSPFTSTVGLEVDDSDVLYAIDATFGACLTSDGHYEQCRISALLLHVKRATCPTALPPAQRLNAV